MRPHLARTLSITLLAATATSLLAQSNIDATSKFSWSENCGFMNWRDAGQGQQGVLLTDSPSFLSGFIWCENVGYLNLGDGTPANGSAYANSTGADFGVNITAGGLLSGLAWGENIGWIKFGILSTLPAAQQARFDAASNRFRGYAWGENIGWINFDNEAVFVGIATSCPGCAADYDLDGGVTGADIAAFFADFEQGLECADVDLDGGITGADIATFFAAFEAGGCE